MEETIALKALSALAHESRLAILRLLVRAGEDGRSAGQIGRRVEASASRLSFHLGVMEQAGLVTSERRSRNVIYRANRPRIGALVKYLTYDCCGERPETCAGWCKPDEQEKASELTLPRAQ